MVKTDLDAPSRVNDRSGALFVTRALMVHCAPPRYHVQSLSTDRHSTIRK